MNLRSKWPALAAAVSFVALAACAPGYGRDDNVGDGTVGAASECSAQSLRLSHQWPAVVDGEGDFRSRLTEDFADEVEKATDGQVNIKVFPNGTLSDPDDQYDAMLSGSLDGAVMPLDYAAGHVPEWSITLMPGLVRSHDDAEEWDTSDIGREIDRSMVDHGLVRLVNVWNAGGIGSKDKLIQTPEDLPSGTTMRAAGTYVEHMLQDAGAGITSLPSSEIYTAMQTGVLDAAVTSASSFASYRLQEQISSYVSPTENTFWFMYEPLVLTVNAYEQLCPEQQEQVHDVAERLQRQAYDDSAADDQRVEKIFKEAGVDVATLDDDEFASWLPLAEKQWDDYASMSGEARKFLELAKNYREDQ